MSKNRRSLRGSIALNLFAVAFTLMPLATLGVWTHQAFFSDHRRVVDLTDVRSDEQPRLFDEPLISITFDDGWESIYTAAAPIMSKHGIASTQYILPGEFNNLIYMSANQALSMKDAGHEISSHTYTHKKLTEIPRHEVQAELDRSLVLLRKFKLVEPDNLTFAAPNGALNDYSRDEVMARFSLARNVNGDLAQDVSANDMNISGKTNRYDVIGYTVGTYTTMEQLRSAIAYAKAHNAWFIPVYHQVDDSGSTYSVSPEQFEAHMKLFSESGIKIVTMRDVLVHNQEKLQ